jgi:hypothetical protein
MVLHSTEVLERPFTHPPRHPLTKYLNESSIAQFANSAYAKPNIAVVANGASQAELSKWVGEFFTEVPSSSAARYQVKQQSTMEERNVLLMMVVTLWSLLSQAQALSPPELI